jgi:ribose/xylose/arabinose/galactoside ABC-type transport system permease subunit
LLSVAAAVIISSGHVDISTGALMSFLGMLVIFLVSIGGGSLVSVLTAHAVSACVGVLIYLSMYLLIGSQVSSLIITLAVFFIAKGLSTFMQICLQGAGVICRSHTSDFFVSTSEVLPSRYVMDSLGTTPVSILFTISIVAGFHYWRHYTLSGLYHVAVGMNPVSAKFAGVSARKVHFFAFLQAGALVTTATFLRLHGQSHGGGAANTGWGEELLAIAIAVIGGTRIKGGRLDPIAVALAALFVYAMRDVVTNDLRLPTELASIVFGIIMATIVWIDSHNTRGQLK